MRKGIATGKPYLIDAQISADQNPGGAGVWELPGLGGRPARHRRAVSAELMLAVTTPPYECGDGTNAKRDRARYEETIAWRQQIPPRRSKGFKLLGHDPLRRLGRRQHRQVHKGYAYVGAVGGASYNGPEGFTAHDVRDPRNPKKVYEFKRAARRALPQAARRRRPHPLCQFRAAGRRQGPQRPRRAVHLRHQQARPAASEVGFYDTPGSGPHRFGVDNKRKLAFLPNDAPGWNKRVIWTLDIKDPLKPEVVSIWGLPWQKAEGDGEGDDPMPARGARSRCTARR